CPMAEVGCELRRLQDSAGLLGEVRIQHYPRADDGGGKQAAEYGQTAPPARVRAFRVATTASGIRARAAQDPRLADAQDPSRRLRRELTPVSSTELDSISRLQRRWLQLRVQLLQF